MSLEDKVTTEGAPPTELFREVKLNSKDVLFRGSQGEVLLTAKFSDLYFYIGNVLPEYEKVEFNCPPGEKRIQVFKAFAKVFNPEFSCDLSWSQLWNLTIQLDAELEKIKKNEDEFLQGLPIVTDSVPMDSTTTN